MLLLQPVQPFDLTRAPELRLRSLRQRQTPVAMPILCCRRLTLLLQPLLAVLPHCLQQPVTCSARPLLVLDERFVDERGEQVEDLRILDFGFWILDWVRQRLAIVRSL